LPVNKRDDALHRRLGRHIAHPLKAKPRRRPCGWSDGEEISNTA
jgi:hypothetical protein